MQACRRDTILLDILFETAAGTIQTMTKDKKYLLRATMSGILETLNRPAFQRIHRSVIINLDYISEIVKSPGPEYSVKMVSGKQFKIGRSYKDNFFKILNI